MIRRLANIVLVGGACTRTRMHAPFVVYLDLVRSLIQINHECRGGEYIKQGVKERFGDVKSQFEKTIECLEKSET